MCDPTAIQPWFLMTWYKSKICWGQFHAVGEVLSTCPVFSFRDLVWYPGRHWNSISHHQRLCHRRHLWLHSPPCLCIQVWTLCWTGPCRGEVSENSYAMMEAMSSRRAKHCLLKPLQNKNIFLFTQVHDGIRECQSFHIQSVWLWEQVRAQVKWNRHVWRTSEILQVYLVTNSIKVGGLFIYMF